MTIQSCAKEMCIIIAISFGTGATALATEPQQPTMSLSPGQVVRIDSVFRRWNSAATPGCALGIYHDGQIVYEKAFGMADLERAIPLNTNSVLPVQSMTKMFIATTIFMLVHEGKLSLDDNVRRYVPELPAYASSITIRQLLRLTSGFPDIGNLVQLAGYRDDEHITTGEYLKIIARMRHLNHAPGTAYSYNNDGMVLLPLIVERITGRPMSEVMHDRIFQPLGMENTFFRENPSQIIRGRALAYSREKEYVNAQNSSNHVFTTVGDLAKWDRGMSTGSVLGTIPDSMAKRTVLPDGTVVDYGQGMEVMDFRGLTAILHSGSASNGNSVYMRWPAMNTSVSVICNAGDASAINRGLQVSTIVLDSAFAHSSNSGMSMSGSPATAEDSGKRVVMPANVVRRFAGTYFGYAGGPSVRRFGMQGDTLCRLADNKCADLLDPVGSRTFHLRQSPINYEFESNADGKVVGVRRIVTGQHTLQLARVGSKPRASVTAYAGRYCSDDLGTCLQINVEGTVLRNHWPRDPQGVELDAVFEDGFEDGFGTYRFIRDRADRIIGLDFHQERIWKLHFQRVGANESGSLGDLLLTREPSPFPKAAK